MDQASPAQWKGPSEHSVLCSDHFNEDCFEPDTVIASSIGLDIPRRRLKADAVPTIFKRAAAPVLTATGKRLASEGPGSSSTDPEGSQSKKVRRGAYEKRERARLIQEMEMDVGTSSSASASAVEIAESGSGSNTQDAGTQTSPSRMNAYTQVKPKTSTKD